MRRRFELGGWKSYEMVLRYAHLAPEKFKSVAQRIERQRAADMLGRRENVAKPATFAKGVHWVRKLFIGAPGEIRTPDHLVRRENPAFLVFINQSFASLANLEPSLTKAQLWHRQSEHDTFPAQSFQRSAATAADVPGDRLNPNICHWNLTSLHITHYFVFSVGNT